MRMTLVCLHFVCGKYGHLAGNHWVHHSWVLQDPEPPQLGSSRALSAYINFYTGSLVKSEMQKQTTSLRDGVWICHIPWRTENPKINDQITLICICRCLICGRCSIDRSLHFTEAFQITMWEDTAEW